MALLKRKRIGLSDAMSVVTKFVNACNRHDADGVASCLHPDFDSIQPMYPSRNFRGADQVRRNWQAIFDAEPGFRLTVLRTAAMDDTVWLELHGAGREAEVAGVFIMGIQGDRIRWARIYSALVEPVPAGMGEESPAPLHEVPRLDDQVSAGNGEVVEEPLIAPVVDIDRPGRRRRRHRGGDDQASEPTEETADEIPAEVGQIDAEADVDAEPAAVDVVEMVEIEPEVVVVVEEEVDVAPAVVAVVTAEDDGGPPTEAVEMATLTDPDPDPEPESALDFGTLPPPEPAVAEGPVPEPPKRWFGKKGRP